MADVCPTPAPPRTETESRTRYLEATRRFGEADNWRIYLALADEFRALGTYGDASQMSARCVKAASAPAYREVTEGIASADPLTAEALWEAARILGLISDYRDARETARVYVLKGNSLAYDEAVALLSNADATTDEMERGVLLLREIRTFRDSRDLLARFEKYYFERMYDEGSRLAESAYVFSEYEEAAAIFERIAPYSDAAARAAACRKRAEKLRPRKKPTRQKDLSPSASVSDPETTIVRPHRRKDESQNTVGDILRGVDKRRLVIFLVWLIFLAVDVYASIALPRIESNFVLRYANEIRGMTALLAILAAVMTVRAFIRMLTASMRKALRDATVRTLKKMVAPLVRVAAKLLSSIGIDLGRKRLGGRDETTFVFHESAETPKKRRRLKNDLKWQDQTDNAARVRFLFIDHMLKHIKSGYAFKRTLTPTELGHTLSAEPDDQALFDLYNLARYAENDAKSEITNDMVEKLRKRVDQI